MKTREIILQRKDGLSSQLACFFIQKANQFSSEILMEYHEKKVNAKSLLGVLSLCVPPRAVIRLHADGPDEEEAIDALEEFLK